jgi:hypothetical protein
MPDQTIPNFDEFKKQYVPSFEEFKLSPEAQNALLGNIPESRPIQEFINASAEQVGRTALELGGIVVPKLKEYAEENYVPPGTTAGKAGKLLTDIGVQLLPGGRIAKAAEVIKNPLLRAGARIGTEAGVAGILGEAQAGGNREQGLIDAGITAGMGIFGHLAGLAMSRYGHHVQMKGMMPRTKDWKEGFDPKVIGKLGLKGNLQQSYEQVLGKLSKLRTERNALIKQTPGLEIDIGKIMDSAEAEIIGNVSKLKHAGMAQSINNAFGKIKKDILDSVGQQTDLPIEIVENAKESIGLLGAWAYGSRELDANATEIVANVLYTKLRQAIENKLPTGTRVHDLNAEMAKLIPIRNAMIARIPVEERNSVASLADVAALIPMMMSGNPLHAALPMLTRTQKSMRMGNWFTRTAPNVPGMGTNIGRVLAGGTQGTPNPFYNPEGGITR